ncbi:MAG: hypothetical protein DHS20C04_05300 [Hyphococcus sp.]|nr:MAG: hypothetical protein DHS20C04_05300 [Marinicaulis sp.]
MSLMRRARPRDIAAQRCILQPFGKSRAQNAPANTAMGLATGMFREAGSAFARDHQDTARAMGVSVRHEAQEGAMGRALGMPMQVQHRVHRQPAAAGKALKARIASAKGMFAPPGQCA